MTESTLTIVDLRDHTRYLFTPDKQDLYKHLGWQWARTARVQGQWVDVMVKLLNDELDV